MRRKVISVKCFNVSYYSAWEKIKMEPLKCQLRFINYPMNPSTGDLQLCRADFIQEEKQMSAEHGGETPAGTICKNTQPPSAVHKLLHITVQTLLFSMWREICFLSPSAIWLVTRCPTHKQSFMRWVISAKWNVQFNRSPERICVCSLKMKCSIWLWPVWIYSTESFGCRESVFIGGETASSTKIHS